MYVLQLVSPGTVSPASGHSLTPETLKLCVAMVNDAANIAYPRNVLRPMRCDPYSIFYCLKRPIKSFFV